MTLPAAITDAIITEAAKQLAAQTIADMRDLQLVPIRKAAELLGVSERKARKLLRSRVELGEATRRVRLSDIRRLIEERTINHV